MLKQLVQNLIRRANPSLSKADTKMVIIIRSDLKMGRGKIASQVAHAAVSLFDISSRSSSPHLKPWFESGQPKIILQTDSYESLMNFYKEAQRRKLTVCAIHDAGRSQVACGSLTAVGIGPHAVTEVNELTATLKLL